MSIANIMNGEDFPHRVSILDTGNFSCAGSVINAMLIVTTAQCLQYSVAKNVQVIAGIGPGIRSTNKQTRDIQTFYTHEHFDSDHYSPMNDIGVIVLNKPLEFTESVQMISLPIIGEEFEGKVSLVGWKYKSASGFQVSNQLKKVDASIVSDEVCIKNYADTSTPLRDNTNIMCTGKSASVRENFGGGVVCYRQDTNEPVLCGIVACGECRGKFGLPRVSVKVSRYLDWIDNTGVKLIEKIKCRSHEFFCSSSLSCITRAEICNGVQDCSEGEDEVGCDSKEPCDLEEFRCRNGNCIQGKFFCDEFNDCRDGSDEAKCPARDTTCADEEHRCGSGRCISIEFRCDQNYDCDDNSDETGCIEENDPNPSKGSTDLTIPEGTREKEDKRYKCSTDSFYCSSGCLNRTFVCDGAADCEDGTDELNCAQGHSSPCAAEEFRCDNGLCRSYSVVCNKNDDCGDSSDEMKCPRDDLLCNSDEFQCDFLSAFRCIPSTWKCDGFLDCDEDSDEVNCTISGAEETLPFHPPSSNPSPACSATQFQCGNRSLGVCIPINWRCDGQSDCLDGEDEKECIQIEW